MIEKESEEMKHEIMFYLKMIKDTEKDWKKIDKDIKPTVYYGLGTKSKNIAVCNLLLENNKESLKWFKKSAEYYIKSLEYEKQVKGDNYSEVVYCQRIFFTSLFSKDKNLIKKSLDFISSINEDYPKKYGVVFAEDYYYLNALCRKIRKDNKGANLFFSKMKIPEKNFDLLGRGIYFFTEGLVKENRELCQKGAENLGRSHSSKVRVGGWIIDKYVNFYLTAFLIISKMLGMEIEIKDDYVPEFLLEGVNKV